MCVGRLAITAGCVVRTATVRSSGSSTSLQKNTKTGFSTLRMIRTAGSIASPPALSKFVRGKKHNSVIWHGAVLDTKIDDYVYRKIPACLLSVA